MLNLLLQRQVNGLKVVVMLYLSSSSHAVKQRVKETDLLRAQMSHTIGVTFKADYEQQDFALVSKH